MAEASREKVHSIQDFTRSEKPRQDDMEDIKRKSEKDMGKVAIFISILSVLLLVIFFFGLNQNITGLNQEVQNLGALRQDVGTLATQFSNIQQTVGSVQENVGSLENRFVELEKLPAQTRNMILMNDLNAMNQRLGHIGSQLSGQQATRLQEAQQLLQQLQTELAQ
ncbi:hypothetical protein PCS_01539 [Desulfocurvibacter africanus PCS]|uniref:Uncharacterized protein n=1 Tax=Desulfocurvibacter africanus PCS TaxID=1262666 RepID=M5Q1I3_DESAF|nr:hypothetical protein [Desulfocurvibacter africanus]EMG37601.1 hypothetical protein PCS_01539 [Desulfocurvibacter africanus PCS]